MPSNFQSCTTIRPFIHFRAMLETLAGERLLRLLLLGGIAFCNQYPCGYGLLRGSCCSAT